MVVTTCGIPTNHHTSVSRFFSSLIGLEFSVITSSHNSAAFSKIVQKYRYKQITKLYDLSINKQSILKTSNSFNKKNIYGVCVSLVLGDFNIMITCKL